MSNPILKCFEFKHLPTRLQLVSSPLAVIAAWVEEQFPDCAEKSAGLRKLLEAKDCFVRAALEPKQETATQPPGPTKDPDVIPMSPWEGHCCIQCEHDMEGCLEGQEAHHCGKHDPGDRGMRPACRSFLAKASAPVSIPEPKQVPIRFNGDYCGNIEGPCPLMMQMQGGPECRQSPVGYKLRPDIHGGYFRTLKCKHYICGEPTETKEDAHD